MGPKVPHIFHTFIAQFIGFLRGSHGWGVSRMVEGRTCSTLFFRLISLILSGGGSHFEVYDRTCAAAEGTRGMVAAIARSVTWSPLLPRVQDRTLYLAQVPHLRNWIGQFFRIHFGTTYP